MCYMERVGVRELRQNASALLDQVAHGVTIEITNHGRLVARLVPAESGGSTRAELMRRGLLKPGQGSVLDVVAVTAPAGTPPLAELLADLQDER